MPLLRVFMPESHVILQVWDDGDITDRLIVETTEECITMDNAIIAAIEFALRDGDLAKAKSKREKQMEFWTAIQSLLRIFQYVPKREMECRTTQVAREFMQHGDVYKCKELVAAFLSVNKNYEEAEKPREKVVMDVMAWGPLENHETSQLMRHTISELSKQQTKLLKVMQSCFDGR